MKTLILGGGVTGLAAGMASGLPIREMSVNPGGLCASYTRRGYLFERAGGHWLFGHDPYVLRCLDSICRLNHYERKASVFFPDNGELVPYPIQQHLKTFPPVATTDGYCQPTTMKVWLEHNFGAELCERFFRPFNALYTAGLYDRIAPQDAYKNPLTSGGYNITFAYPSLGLATMVRRMADRCGEIRYNKCVVRIDPIEKTVSYSDYSIESYEYLISTLPLNEMLRLTGLHTEAPEDPHTSVHVVNIGARRGPRCPDAHWLYLPKSRHGFHRVGFYSNVDKGFLPTSVGSTERVSLYVERAYIESDVEEARLRTLDSYERGVASELQEWGFIDEVEDISSTWVDVAYTWSWLGSRWREEALELLERHRIYQCGRYGRWKFQGILESIRDGFVAGASFK